MSGTHSTHEKGRGGVHTIFWLDSLKGRDHLETLAVEERVILELILGK
jgi:hypothetical protein